MHCCVMNNNNNDNDDDDNIKRINKTEITTVICLYSTVHII